VGEQVSKRKELLNLGKNVENENTTKEKERAISY